MQKKGFTLLELIIVIVIIGILASFALPRYFKAAERARSGEAISLLGTLRSAQIRYKAEKGQYSTDCTILDVDIGTPKFFGAPACTNAGTEIAALVALTRVSPPANPIDGTLYTLTISPSGAITCLPASTSCTVVTP